MSNLPMKRMLLAIFSALFLSASAQITVTSASFPASGDTLKFVTDISPSASLNAASAPGGNQLWDFSSLQNSQTDEIVYQPASAGVYSMSFPSADLVLIGQTGETYYNVTNTKFEVLGFAGSDPAGFGLNVLAKFAPAFSERTSPLNFFDVSQQQTNLSLPFSTAALPDSLFGGALALVDSIRVRTTTSRLGVVDGWGNCKIPSGQYPVLRLKRTDYTTTALDVKVPFLGWVDLATLSGGAGGGLGGFIGTDTTITYRFYNNVEKEEIAVATMSNDLSTVETVRFKDNETTAAPEPFGTPNGAGIQAYPNPAVEYVRFDCSNLPQDDYTLKIYNIIGKVIWKEQYTMAGTRSIRIELESFKKGTYLYSLVSSKGNIIGTKRLVVLKP